LLGFVLLRYLNVRVWIAMMAALVFACDPVQIVHEHLIMAETAALLATAAFLVTSCRYLRAPDSWLLVWLSFPGILLVGLRIVYLPIAFVSAVALPLAAYFWSPAWPKLRRPLTLALALGVSCTSTVIAHLGYTHLTGYLAEREPAYNYVSGFFLMSAVAPILKAEYADDARVARAVIEQNQSALPLSSPGSRTDQLWDLKGLATRMKTAFDGNIPAANRAAQRLADRAILRNPAGFAKLAIRTYIAYWVQIPSLRWFLRWENGSPPGKNEVLPFDISAVRSAFGVDVSNQYLVQTPSRRFHFWAWPWSIFLLASPFLAGFALWLDPRDDKEASHAAALLFVWSCFLLTATCFGSTEASYRYLHPLSFTGLAGVAFLMEKLCRRASNPALPIQPVSRKSQ
jgi:hypothetical protein